METIKIEKYGRVDVFEPVTEIPFGYSVWAIGRHNFPHEKCIPLCKPIKTEYDWQRCIDPNSLKYIEVESEELALRIFNEAIRHGCDKKRFYEIINS